MHLIQRRFALAVVGSADLYKIVRAALVANGSSLNEWCKANGINRQTAEKALKGERHSKTAEEIRSRLVAELFPDEDAA